MAHDTAHAASQIRQERLRSNTWRVLVSVGLAVVVTPLLVRRVEPADFRVFLQSSMPEWLALALGTYVGMNAVRGTRFSVLSKFIVPPGRAAGIAAAHNLFLAALPLRSGELTFVGMMGREPGIGAAWAAKMLAAVRIMDAVVLGAVFCVTCFVGGFAPASLRALAGVGIAAAVAGLSLLVWPNHLAAPVRRLWETIAHRSGGPDRRWVSRLNKVVAQALTVADAQWFRRSLPGLLALTLCLWTLAALLSVFCLRAIGIEVGFWGALYLTSALFITSALPIHGVAGLGPQDAIGAVLLMSLGFAEEVAIPAQLAWHLQALAYAIIAGAGGWAIVASGKGRRAQATGCAEEEDNSVEAGTTDVG